MSVGSARTLLSGCSVFDSVSDALHDDAGVLVEGGRIVAVGPAGQIRARAGGPLDPTVMAQLTGWLAARGRTPQRLQLGRRSLEDVFLDLTGRSLR